MKRFSIRLAHLGLWLSILALLPVSLWVFIGFGLSRAMGESRPEETTEPSSEDERTLRQRVLKDADVFRGLSDPQLNTLASLTQRVHVEAGEVLGRAGQHGDRLFIIVQGEAQLSAPTALGDVTVRIAGRGESFPLAALAGSGTLITTGKALTDLDLLVIPRSLLAAFCSQRPEVGITIFRNISAMFVDRYGKTLERLTLSAERVLENSDFLANI